ncbi:hypothetical protein [Acinetobacter puyangensis]|uniref:hypothetical protein n=1 Tax=Acinetobacter puyangensis TaxID=1096779 RepID=UPI003A4D72BC
MSHFKGLEEKFKKIQPLVSPVSGQWSLVRWNVDFISNDQIAIGIIFENNGFLHTKFIDDYGRLECVYGNDISRDLEFVIDLIEFTLKRNYKKSISPQIMFEQRGFAQGESIEAILLNLFNRAVPFGKPHDQIIEIAERFPTYRTSSLISNVKSSLFNKIGPNIYNIFPEKSWLTIQDNKDTLQIEVPIRPKDTDQLGGIISTIYRTYDRFETSCLTALTDLQLAKKFHYGEDVVLFTLLPNEYSLSLLPEHEQEKRYKFLKELDSKLELNEIIHKKFNDQNLIANEILHWSKFQTQNDGLFS